MWVMIFFFNEHMWSHPPVKGEGSAALCSWEIWLSVWFVTRCWTLQQAHITVLLIMQITAKTQLILHDVIDMSITRWTVIVLCPTEQLARHSLLQEIMFNIQPGLNVFKWIKSNTFWNINSYSLIEQDVTRKIW